MALVIALGFAACELDTAPRVTVKFEDPNGGNTFGEVLVEKGKSLGGQLPANLTREGPYVFYGWFDGTTQYFSDTPIGADITLTARWADDIATITFEFTQEDSGKLIEPTAPIYPITLIKGSSLGSVAFPADPRSKGYEFKGWKLEDDTFFTPANAVDSDITVTAVWAKTTKKIFKVTFDPGPGGGSKTTMEVYEGECIDEWEPRFPANPTVNTVNPKAFFVAWFDDENRPYDGRTPITRNLNTETEKILGKWGLPPYIIDFDEDVILLEASTDAAYGDVDYSPQVVNSVIDGKRAIVNTETYEVPYNTNRWRILYRISFKLPDDFNTGFYTRYTIRARFYANEQGAKSWTDETAFTPNVPAAAAGYSRDGWLRKAGYGELDADGITWKEYSRSEDGWGQISWTSEANWNGQGADEQTMLQRYNLDRKGGTINDTWAPLRSKELAYPPYLLIQTSDAYIGHIEITEIVFHNGVEYTAEQIEKDPTLAALDEWKYTAYADEPKPESSKEGE